MTSLSAYEYDELEWQLSHRTDVLKVRQGLESRVACNLYPEESYRATYVMSEAELREVRRLLYLTPAAVYSVPLVHEALVVQSLIAGFTVVVDSTYSDWMPAAAATQAVVVTNISGQQYLANITNVVGHPSTATTLTLDVTVPGVYPGGTSRVLPMVDLDLGDGSPVNKYQSSDGTWRISGRDRTSHAVWGTGATVAAYGGMDLLDRRPVLQDLAEEDNIGGQELLDLGGPQTQVEWARTVSDLVRHHDYYVGAGPNWPAERQWWRKFYHRQKGSQKLFLLPTWRNDLPVSVPPTPGSTTIVITNPPAYDAWWNGSAAQDRILYITDERAGTWTPMTVSNVVNGGATQTLTTVENVPAGTLQKICFLETCRLEDEALTFRISQAAMRAKVSCRVVQR